MSSILGGWERWVIVVATTWIQAFTGTNLDFSSYSTELKSALGISQVELIFLSMASDMGKAFGWCSALCLSLLYFPFWIVLFLAAGLGLIGYGVQWLILKGIVSLPYFPVFILCLVAGCSITWFNTVCYVLCIQNFPTNRALALSLSISFNGISAAIYTLLVDAINSSTSSLYLLLNATVPLATSLVAFFPIYHQRPTSSSSSPPHHLLTNVDVEDHADGLSSFLFSALYLTATVTGLYLITFNSIPLTSSVSGSLAFVGAVVLLALPLVLIAVVYSRNDSTSRWVESLVAKFEGTSFNLVDIRELRRCDDDLRKELIDVDHEEGGGGDDVGDDDRRCHSRQNGQTTTNWPRCEEGRSRLTSCCSFLEAVLIKNRLVTLGEEHQAGVLVRRFDFWLYYMAYLCGGTIGLAYSNNLGQIVQSLGYSSETNFVVTIYSTCSFFGRLMSAAPDFLSNKLFFARTGWLALAIFPTPIAFFLLVASDSWAAICTSTALIGLSSGFVFSAAVSISSELFGPNSAGLNHNILITNIPIGSLSYGLLAAVIYDSRTTSMNLLALKDCMVCMGRVCYFDTFIWFGCISFWGFLCSVLLFLRTRYAYDRFAKSDGLR